MAAIRLEFAQFGHFDSFDVIRSTTSIADVADVDLPTPIATGLKTMHYVDASVIKGLVYYYKVRVWRGGVSVMSGEISAIADRDMYWGNVVSLIHFDDNLNDEKGILNYSIVGSVSYSGTAKFGKSLNLADRTGMLVVNNPAVRLGGSDYTIECFINAKSSTMEVVNPAIFSISNNSSSGDQELIFGIKDDDKKLFFRVYDNGAYILNDIRSSTTISFNAWTHVAIVRSGVNHYIFADGVLSASFSTPNNYALLDKSVELIIGGLMGSGDRTRWGRFDGYIDEFRFTKGIARYTENFTPPTKPFLNS